MRYIALAALAVTAAAHSAPAAEAGALRAGAPFAVTPGVSEADQRWPAVAFGGGVYLAVWQEGEAMAGVADTAIHAARILPDGRTLDPKGIPVCMAAGFQAYPAVCFDGANFLVVWQDYRGGKDWDIYAARVSPRGEVLDAGGVAIAAGPGNQIYPTVAHDGADSLVVWSDIRPGFSPEVYQLWGAFVADGRPGDAGGRLMGKAAESLLSPRLVPLRRGYLLAAGRAAPGWEPALPWLARVGPDGAAVELNLPWRPFQAQTWSAASDPASGRAVFWSNQRGEHGSYIVRYLSCLLEDAAGTPKMSRHAAAGLQERYPPRNDLWCDVTWTGRSFLAVVEQSPDVYGADGRHMPRNVDIVATRIDAATGALVDVMDLPVPDTAKGADLRPAYDRLKKPSATLPAGVLAAGEPAIQERHPALASAGDGTALLLYSRRGGIGRYFIHGVVLRERFD